MEHDPYSRDLRSDDVRRLCGDILGWKVDAILASGVTLPDLEIAVAWLTGGNEVMGKQRSPLEGAAASVYDLLASGEDFPGDDDSEGRA
ncbi:MAG TPA: hypothetical protein VN814_10950 [Caulobacteraceae bacterium]|nr:hypothetical protein [Caulobacteraceae bacterium]